jgi:SAM-dependent methyltransferase
VDREKEQLSRNKYKLPYHWIRDPLHRHSLPYFGYAKVVLDGLPKPPATVLDAGCGDGRISAEIVDHGYKLVGIDYLELSVIYAKTLVTDGTFLAGDLREDLTLNCGLEERQFDAVVMIEVYEHIPPKDCPVVLENLAHLLRSGGKLIISVPSKSLPLSKLHYRHFERQEFERELEMAGFGVQEIICQHRIDRLTRWLLSDRIDGLLNNRWLQPVFLKRWRRRLYMRYSNVVSNGTDCGRFIAIAIP